MISDHIKDIMTAYKEKPNSEFKNRVISHLKDAYALALVDEGGRQDAMPHVYVDEVTNVPDSVFSQINDMINDKDCICPAGAIDVACHVHGV